MKWVQDASGIGMGKQRLDKSVVMIWSCCSSMVTRGGDVADARF